MTDPTPPAPADPQPATAPTPPPMPPLDPGTSLPQPPDPPQDQAGRPHLFGAAAPGIITATPGLIVAGVTIDTTPNASLTHLVVLDGASLTWGRQQVMDQPDPAVASLALFDPTATWATKSDLIGQPVTLFYTANKPGVGVVQTPMFLGRITTAKLTRKDVTRADGTIIHGQEVTLTASSILNDLANIIPAEAWPEETMDARRARIQTYSVNAGVLSSITIRGYWKTPNAQPYAVNEQVSILAHLVNLYNSTGPDRFTFLPATTAAIQLERRDFYSARTVSSLHWNAAGEGTPRDGKGAYAWSLAMPAYDGGMAGVHLYLDAETIEYDDAAGLSKDITTKLTRILLTHPDGSQAQPYPSLTVVQPVPGANEALIGVRSASQASTTTWNAYGAQAASDLGYMAAREASGWRADPFTVRSSLNGGGFDTWDQLATLLAGAEVISYWFLQRSWFAQLGIRPCFAIIGGTITYTNGEWVCVCQFAPVNTLPMPQHAISWSEIDDGSATYQLEWHDGDDPHGLHESLTYEDIGFVGFGLGMTAVPTDTYGWDVTYP